MWTTATVLQVMTHRCMVVSGGVDCDKKPQRYAKDNRRAHLTARSDKSVAYVTNNKRLYSTFCTVEANYWQTRSIARPLATAELLVSECYSKRSAIEIALPSARLSVCNAPELWVNRGLLQNLHTPADRPGIWLGRKNAKKSENIRNRFSRPGYTRGL